MMSKKRETYKFSDVLTVAFTSQRFNKKYIKDTQVSITLEGKLLTPVIVANKQIMRTLLSDDNMGIHPVALEHIKNSNIQVTDEDRKNSKEACVWLEGLTMRALAGDLNDFESNLYATFEKEEITNYDFGMIASIPQTYLRNIKRENLEDKIQVSCADSDWVAPVGNKINATVELVSGVYSRNYQSYIYVAITDKGQLVTFWSQKDWLDKVGKTVKLNAKVKRTDFSKWYTGIKESQLNYVKVM